MLTKTIVATLLAIAAVALPTKTARDSVTTPDWILSPQPIDENHRPGDAVKRDPNSLVHFYIPGAPAGDAEETAGPDDAPVKRDPNSPVNFWIPDAPTSGAEETADLDKRFYIYHRPPTPGAETVEKRHDIDVIPF
ncbi:uncharacterized protein BHQ10_000569 [Talaromyces amestolkiae]|uniref:Uncharacterized protein n=1 Tax=Talaromyces amestolkiae TaxID=1196081 RepID=A0A364KLZ1_TALAM|nr:uncharacterized protein BHQ10_000569 [Talaromyces amestolkiae]RAO64557.1 hypothetical protein BHQ10_000569 [Talaromyces amestolkiae]